MSEKDNLERAGHLTGVLTVLVSLLFGAVVYLSIELYVQAKILK